jgi:hypothetical protein
MADWSSIAFTIQIFYREGAKNAKKFKKEGFTARSQ